MLYLLAKDGNHLDFWQAIWLIIMCQHRGAGLAWVVSVYWLSAWHGLALMTLVINSIILITVFTFFYANSLKSIFANSNRLPLHTIHVLYPTAFNEYRQFQMQLRHMHKVQKSTKDKHAPIKESAARCSVGAGRFFTFQTVSSTARSRKPSP